MHGKQVTSPHFLQFKLHLSLNCNVILESLGGRTINEELAAIFEPRSIAVLWSSYVNGVYVYPYTCDIDSQIEYHLEEGQYFVLGDNGEASIDSRDFGVISENQLLGKAIAF